MRRTVPQCPRPFASSHFLILAKLGHALATNSVATLSRHLWSRSLRRKSHNLVGSPHFKFLITSVKWTPSAAWLASCNPPVFSTHSLLRNYFAPSLLSSKTSYSQNFTDETEAGQRKPPQVPTVTSSHLLRYIGALHPRPFSSLLSSHFLSPTHEHCPRHSLLSPQCPSKVHSQMASVMSPDLAILLWLLPLVSIPFYEENILRVFYSYCSYLLSFLFFF